ncbi:hypothetical protein Tco_0059480 [Tanacetum coccineum]
MDLPKMIREQTVEFIDSQEIDRKINESVKEVVISSVKHAMRAPLRARFKDLPTSDMKEILLQRMLEENYDKGHANHRVRLREETKKKSKQDSPNTPPGSPPSPPPPPPPPSGASGASGTTGASDSAQAPPPPPPSSSTHQGGQSTSTAAPSSSKTAASAEYSAWTTTDTRIKPSITTIPDDLYMDDETTADEQAYSSGMKENSLLAQTGDMAMFMDWYCKRQGITHLALQDLEGPAFEIVKVFSAYQLVPDQFWIEAECKYDIAALYGISHWWFQRQRFYIDRFSSEGDRRAVRTHMRILSVVRKLKFPIQSLDLSSQGIPDQQGLIPRDEPDFGPEESMLTKQGLHVRYPETNKDKTYLPNVESFCWWKTISRMHYRY